MEISFCANKKVTTEQFIDILNRSTLAERRPVKDIDCINSMLKNASLVVTAWDRDFLVGIARSLTDFNYACYLSDLAVDVAYQKQGIGRALIAHTQQALDSNCSIILLSAPAATEYYPRIGFSQHPSAWTLPRDKVV
jgi:predicted N-acetyltransferase YhbS